MNLKKKRPQILRILCILTFVGSGLSIIGGALGFTPTFVEAGIVKMHEMIANSFDPDAFDKTDFLKWSFYSNLFGLIAGIICLIGGLLMWRLNKKGYYIYIVGWIIHITISIMAIQHMNTSDTLTSGVVQVGFLVVIMGTFVALYGMQLKRIK